MTSTRFSDIARAQMGGAGTEADTPEEIAWRAAVEAAANDLEERVNVLEAWQSETIGQLGILQATVDANSQNIADILTALIGITSTIATHTSVLATHTAALADHTALLSTHTTQIAALALNMPQSTVKTTNSSGRVTWTYPVAFAAPPCLQSGVLSTNGQPFSIREVSRTATACELEVQNSAVVSVLGISVSAALVTVGAGFAVGITAQVAGA